MHNDLITHKRKLLILKCTKIFCTYERTDLQSGNVIIGRYYIH